MQTIPPGRRHPYLRRPRSVTSARAGLAVAAMLGTAQVAPAAASVIGASGAAFGESVSITVTPPLLPGTSITSGAMPLASGTAPSAYNVTQTAASALVTGALGTGLMTTTASSNVDGLPGARFSDATATVNNLAINILSVLGLSADTVFSSADLSGTAGSLIPIGTTTITNLRLSGVLVATANLAANTVILNAGGVKVTLNEQVITGAGTNNQTLLVNAIDVSLVNAAQPILGSLGQNNLLNGNILIGQSKVALSAVADASPVAEPASMTLLASGLASGLAGIGLSRGRRKVS